MTSLHCKQYKKNNIKENNTIYIKNTLLVLYFFFQQYFSTCVVTSAFWDIFELIFKTCSVIIFVPLTVATTCVLAIATQHECTLCGEPDNRTDRSIECLWKLSEDFGNRSRAPLCISRPLPLSHTHRLVTYPVCYFCTFVCTYTQKYTFTSIFCGLV